jgi:hypothetical protein
MPKEYGTPGPRAIYPDICTSRSVAACSIEAQLLFDRLVAQADDQGRIEGDIAILKTVCVPLVERITTRNLSRFLSELEAEELIYRYQSGRSSLTQIPTWWRWQQGQRRAYPSRWPAPEGWIDAIYGHGEGSQASYKTWLVAADRGTAPHNAAFRGETRHNGALTHAHTRAPAADAPAPPAADAPAPPAAPAGADSGASTVPDSPQPPASGGPSSRANGTSPRAKAGAARAVADLEASAKAWRSNQRKLAYSRGALTEDQRREMDARDAPVAEIPDWDDRLAAIEAERESVDRPGWAGAKTPAGAAS